MKAITLTLTTLFEMNKYSNQVWELLYDAYKNVKGGLQFSSIEDLINTTNQWKIVMLNNKIMAITIYKIKIGIKIVAFAANKKYKKFSISSLIKLLNKELLTSYIEISEKAEEFIFKYCKKALIIPNIFVQKILSKDIELCVDGIHYKREINGIVKEKILVGTIKI